MGMPRRVSRQIRQSIEVNLGGGGTQARFYLGRQRRQVVEITQCLQSDDRIEPVAVNDLTGGERGWQSDAVLE